MNDRSARPAGGPRPVRTGAPPRPPARVFWIRRFVVLGLPLILVVWLVVWWTGRDGGAEPRPEAETPAATATPTPTAAAPGVPDCDPSVLDLTLTASAETFTESDPTFEVSVTNTGEEPCLVEAGDLDREVVVTSGEDRVWSSRDCVPEDAPARTLLLADGQADVTSLTWARERSAEGCAGGLPAPGAGTYSATVTMGGATSAPAVFGLG